MAPPGSDLEQRLIAAVLAGHCSDTNLAAVAGLAGDLLKALAPERFLAMDGRDLPDVYLVRTGHRSVANLWYKNARQAAQQRLRDRDPRFEDVLRAVRVSRGQSGTTSMWSDTAREIASIYGPCWLATEITVIGAAADRSWTIGGTASRDGLPFGPEPDYGKLLQETRFARKNPGWWQAQYETIADDLSRASWCLALIAVASDDVILANIDRLDAATTQLPTGLQCALSSSSSRLGASHFARRLRPGTLQGTGPIATLTALLLSHHSIQTGTPADPILDPLIGLTDQQLGEMGQFGVAGWPGLYALSARLGTSPSTRLATGLQAHGQQAVVKLPTARVDGPRPLCLQMLKSPSKYPLAWVLAAERSIARAYQDDSLAAVAQAEAWFPSAT
jgi:hypothetical protein